MPSRNAVRAALATLVLCAAPAFAAPRQVTFGAVATPVRVNEPFVVTVTVEAPDAEDCAKDVSVTGHMRLPGREPLTSKGTCDSPDGTTFRVRFVPTAAGEYEWSVRYAQGEYVRTGRGSVTVLAE
jgi:hypothetical protein